MNKQAATITSIIPRYAPLSDKAMIFYPSTRENGQIQAYVDGKTVTVGIDVYMATERLAEADSKKIALEYAKHENIDPTTLVVRQRLPKQQKEVVRHNRRTNDANLTLVESDKNGDKQNLAKAAQNLHDSQTQKANKQETAKSTPENPEGATVQRQKRKYVRKTGKELSKRSAAALRRYNEELARTASQSPTMMEGVAHNLPPAEFEKKVADLTAEIVKILLKNPGVL